MKDIFFFFFFSIFSGHFQVFFSKPESLAGEIQLQEAAESSSDLSVSSSGQT